MLTKLDAKDLAQLIVPRFLRPPFSLLPASVGLHLPAEIEARNGARAALRHPLSGERKSRIQNARHSVLKFKEETETQIQTVVAPSPVPVVQRWLDVREAAAYLGVSIGYIRRLIHDGELKAGRLGMNFRIDRLDLDQLMLRRKRIVAPYRHGTKPWVSARHKKNRRALRSR
jgi:excisionase family DNA binding protein